MERDAPRCTRDTLTGWFALVVFLPSSAIVKHSLWMPVAIGPRLSEVEVRWRYPLGDALGVLSSLPSLVEQPMVGATHEGQGIDVGSAVYRPFVDMVGLGEITGDGASGPRAATVLGVQHNPLGRAGDPLCLGEVEFSAGVLVVDAQIVMRMTGHPDHIRHWQPSSAARARDAGFGFQLLQRRGDDDPHRQPAM